MAKKRMPSAREKGLQAGREFRQAKARQGKADTQGMGRRTPNEETDRAGKGKAKIEKHCLSVWFVA